MWQMIGVLTEPERTRAGVKAAQHRGVKFGRRPKLTPQKIKHAEKLSTPANAAKTWRRS
jgi:DNA invertase Pin-like site-specific DNA recombinase